MMQEHGVITVQEMTMKWKINDFIVKIKDSKFCYKSFFMSDPDGKSNEWFACLKIKGTKKIFFALSSERDGDFFATFSILDNTNLKKCEREFCEETKWLRKHFLDLNHLKENAATLLPGGTLSILLEIKIQSSKPQQVLQSSKNGCLSNDLNAAFADMDHTDCVIHCGEDEKMKCHSFMLGARSPVFRAMLSSGFQVRELYRKFRITTELLIGSLQDSFE